MKLLLRDLSTPLCAAWRHEFGGLPDVLVQDGDIFSSPVDACVSPANSFGWMDGGIDGYYMRVMGADIEDRVQDQILHSGFPYGEVLIGQAMLVSTGYENCPHLIMAPTMRTPGPTTQLAVFLSTRAALHLAKSHDFGAVAMPGMGTLTGRVPVDLAARAMREAYDQVFGR